MTTALERLQLVSGALSGVSAGVALRSLTGAAGIAGALLAGWSGLPSAAAEQHLLSNGPTVQQRLPQQYYLSGKLEIYPIASLQSYPLFVVNAVYPITGVSIYPLRSEQSYPAKGKIEAYPISTIESYPLLAKNTYPIATAQTYPLTGRTQTYG